MDKFTYFSVTLLFLICSSNLSAMEGEQKTNPVDSFCVGVEALTIGAPSITEEIKCTLEKEQSTSVNHFVINSPEQRITRALKKGSMGIIADEVDRKKTYQHMEKIRNELEKKVKNTKNKKSKGSKSRFVLTTVIEEKTEEN